MERCGISPTGSMKQTRTSLWSTVMSIPTDQGALFFKASAQGAAFEAALTHHLAGRYPHCLPEVIAIDSKRGWMLMRDGGQPLRNVIRSAGNPSAWKAVIPLYAEIQAGMADHVPVLLEIGVPDRRLASLPDHYARLLADTPILRLNMPDGLTSEEHRKLQQLSPHFGRACSELFALGIPETLNHGDFHDGNVLLKDGQVTLFDWGDASIAHPFVSLRTLFVSIDNSLGGEGLSSTPEAGELLAMYLESWKSMATVERLLSGYACSRCVASIISALGWQRTVATLDPSAREKYAGIVPELMREFLTHEVRLTA